MKWKTAIFLGKQLGRIICATKVECNDMVRNVYTILIKHLKKREYSEGAVVHRLIILKLIPKKIGKGSC